MWNHEACQHLTGKKTAWRLVCVRELKMTWVNYPTSRADKNPEFLRRKLVSALLGLPLKHWVTRVLARCSIVMNISVQVKEEEFKSHIPSAAVCRNISGTAKVQQRIPSPPSNIFQSLYLKTHNNWVNYGSLVENTTPNEHEAFSSHKAISVCTSNTIKKPASLTPNGIHLLYKSTPNHW